MPDLQQFAGFARGFHHAAGVRQVGGHLLLAVDLEPGFHAGDGMFGVPEIGRGDDDRVQVVLFLVQQFFVIHVGVIRLAAFGKQAGDAPLVVLRPDIANRREADVGNLHGCVEQHLPFRSGPDERHAQFVGRQIGGSNGVDGQRQAGSRGCGGQQELPPIHGVPAVLRLARRRLGGVAVGIGHWAPS
jgi:hypothetical protein